MATNLHIEPELLDEAQRVGRHRTKRETVNQALREYIQRRRRLKAVAAFGTIAFKPRFDHKRLRKAR